MPLSSTADCGASIRRKLAMSRLMEWIKSHFVAERDVRAAAWALGSRHRGEVSVGARAEIRLPNKTASQRAVLRAVLRDEARKAQTRSRETGPAPDAPK
jgi:hypothetical protein